MIDQAAAVILPKVKNVPGTQGISLPQLTFTRFIAAICIVIFHFKATAFPFNMYSVDNFVKYFNVSVSYFFALSGFILVISGSDKINYKKFYINRFARIYPLYLFALLLTLLLIYNARTPKDTLSFDKIFLSAFLIQSWFKKYALVYNFPAWSLSAEAFFYLIFPIVIFYFRNISLKTEIMIVGTFWVIMQTIVIVMLSNGNDYITAHPIFHLSTFLSGVTAGKLFRDNWYLLKRKLNKLGFILLILIVGLMFLIYSKNVFFSAWYSNGLLAPVFILFIYIVALGENKIFTLLKSKPLQYLGEISYGIYILQIPVAIAVYGIVDRTVKLSPTSTFYFYVLILIITSAITHECIEKPFRKNIKRLLS
ncbi:MAG: acyltransferase [Ginsengibacter sp.]